MRIAITLLSGAQYGALTYCMNFIPALAKADKINEYHLFVQRDHPILAVVHQDNFIFHTCNFSVQSVLMRFLWEQCVMPFQAKKRKIDIIFTLKNLNIVCASCKTMIAIQNIGPFYRWRHRSHWKVNVRCWLLKLLTEISMRKADAIVVVSQSNKELLERLYPAMSEKMVLSRNGIEAIKKTVQSGAPVAKKPFLLSASKFVAYANQLSLIEGYSLLCKTREDVPDLWLAGGVYDRTYFERVMLSIKENGLTEKVKILGWVSHDSLMELYSQADAFVFPSTAETCPMTLIEAMAFGLPTATSNMGPMPEVCQDAAVYFDPFDKEDIAKKMSKILYDQNLRLTLKKKSLERCRDFSWDKIASDMVSILKEVYEKVPRKQGMATA